MYAVRVELLSVTQGLDNAPADGVDPRDVNGWIRDLDTVARRLLTFRSNLEFAPPGVGGRRCAWCGASMPASLAPQARYCCRSHRQRAYEDRLAK
jgi:hypothetical protein